MASLYFQLTSKNKVTKGKIVPAINCDSTRLEDVWNQRLNSFLGPRSLSVFEWFCMTIQSTFSKIWKSVDFTTDTHTILVLTFHFFHLLTKIFAELIIDMITIHIFLLVCPIIEPSHLTMNLTKPHNFTYTIIMFVFNTCTETMPSPYL